uniref:Prospero homeobox protein 1-like n=1 Tax=Kryptolebias marmoratus TaxID=37003 RepID=A0A3Q2ZNT1_KRYMA
MMDSPTDLFDDSSPQMHTFAPILSSADLPAPAFRPPGFPLIHHLLQPGGGPRRIGGMLAANLNAHKHAEDRGADEGEGAPVGQVQQEMEGAEEVGVTGREDNLLAAKKRHGNAELIAEWRHDVLKVKRMKLECRQRDKEAGEGGKRREGRRREREELKEQLEEARERLQALQEKVWRAFGEKHMAEKDETKRKRHIGNSDEGEGDEGLMEEEDIIGGMYDEEDIDGGEIEKETFSLFSDSPFNNFHKQKEEQHEDRKGRMERGREGHLGGVMEGSGLWLDCGGPLRGDWDGGIEDEGEEGGQKFAQALKLELGSAVARVIDRVLRLYTEMTDAAPSSPPAAVSFLPSDPGHDGGKERGRWTGLLTRRRVEETLKEKVDAEREKQIQNGGSLPPGPPRLPEPSDLAAPLAAHRSPDTRKAYPLLGPPLPANLNPSHPNLPLHHPSLPRPAPLPHPPLLPAVSQPKDHSSSSFHPSSSSSSSSSSFPAPPPPPPPPLPLPLLHYSMQQLFSRSLHHPQLSHLAPSRKDYLSSDPFLEFSSHPSFPPLPLLGHLDPSLTRHGGRDRERGVRGDGGMRGGGGIDGGDLYLTAGGISFSFLFFFFSMLGGITEGVCGFVLMCVVFFFLDWHHVYTQEGLSPCHLKKAKLMFFYTRYPSSNTLKTYFPDVKVSVSHHNAEDICPNCKILLT